MLHALNEADKEPAQRRPCHQAACHREHESWRNGAYGETIGCDGSYGESIDEQRARVIQQALAFEDCQDAMGRPQRAEHGGRGSGIGWSDHGAKSNRGRPGHLRHEGTSDQWPPSSTGAMKSARASSGGTVNEGAPGRNARNAPASARNTG